MISEGPCDTEVMTMKIQLYHHRNTFKYIKYFQTENSYFKLS